MDTNKLSPAEALAEARAVTHYVIAETAKDGSLLGYWVYERQPEGPPTPWAWFPALPGNGKHAWAVPLADAHQLCNELNRKSRKA